MTFSQVKEIVGTELETRLTALFIPNLGLYYDEVPANYERLFVRFWFPFDGLYRQGYNAGESISRPLLQVDVRHFPVAGSTATPPAELSERVWEALKLERLSGVAGCKRQPDGRAPMKDANDYSRWGWHRFMLYV
jgi:hypothetical protein